MVHECTVRITDLLWECVLEKCMLPPSFVRWAFNKFFKSIFIIMSVAPGCLVEKLQRSMESQTPTTWRWSYFNAADPRAVFRVFLVNRRSRQLKRNGIVARYILSMQAFIAVIYGMLHKLVAFHQTTN